MRLWKGKEKMYEQWEEKRRKQLRERILSALAAVAVLTFVVGALWEISSKRDVADQGQQAQDLTIEEPKAVNVGTIRIMKDKKVLEEYGLEDGTIRIINNGRNGEPIEIEMYMRR